MKHQLFQKFKSEQNYKSTYEETMTENSYMEVL